MVLKKVIKISDDVYEEIEKFRQEWKLQSANQVLKRVFFEIKERCLSEKDHDLIDQRCDPEELLKNFLNACIAKRIGKVYLLDCKGKKAIVNEKTLRDLVEKFALNIIINDR
jgi:predicted CopG family antitoxin